MLVRFVMLKIVSCTKLTACEILPWLRQCQGSNKLIEDQRFCKSQQSNVVLVGNPWVNNREVVNANDSKELFVDLIKLPAYIQSGVNNNE